MTTVRRWKLVGVLQAFTVALALVAGMGLVVSAQCVPVCLQIVRNREIGGVMFLLLSLGVTTACGCCLAALGMFFRMCGRMKRGTTFTAQNCRALRRISACCLLAGGVLIPALITAFCHGAMVPLWFSLGTAALVFALVTIGLMIRAVYLLMLRAEKMQQDVDFTV